MIITKIEPINIKHFEDIFNPTLCLNTVFLPIERYWDGLDNPTSFRLVNFGVMKMGAKI
jgi:hypothetical protein